MATKKTKQTGMDKLSNSTFLKELRPLFFDTNNKPTWPGNPAGTRTARAASEMPVALKAMILLVKRGTPLPAASAATALGKVKAAAAAAKWPGPNAKVPKAWEGRRAKYRLFEVAWAINIMMKAFANSGGSGGPRDWPSGGNP